MRDACAIINHQLELQRVKIIQDLAEELPELRGNSNQLQQVLMNLMINAQQAMDGTPGTVTVSTKRAERGRDRDRGRRHRSRHPGRDQGQAV